MTIDFDKLRNIALASEEAWENYTNLMDGPAPLAEKREAYSEAMARNSTFEKTFSPEVVRCLVDVCEAARYAAGLLESSDNGWTMDPTRDALTALAAKLKGTP